MPQPPTSTGDTGALRSLTSPESLRSRVEERLREAMVAGELEPGVIYSAPRLAEQLGVSPTPVREAMMELAGEGFVEPLRHRGYRVVEMSDDTLAQVTQVRALLEIPSVGEVAAIAGGRTFPELRRTADELVSTASEGELQLFIAADMRFHLGLLELLGNDVLVDEVRRLRRRTRLYGLRALADAGELLPSAREHHDLLDRIEAGDAEGARTVMRHHLGHVRGVWAGLPES